jgi:hypothetical protein
MSSLITLAEQGCPIVRCPYPHSFKSNLRLLTRVMFLLTSHQLTMHDVGRNLLKRYSKSAYIPWLEFAWPSDPTREYQSHDKEREISTPNIVLSLSTIYAKAASFLTKATESSRNVLTNSTHFD